MLINYFHPITAAASEGYAKSANIANVFFIVFLVLSIAALAFAIYCFFRFNIIKIINDLSGRTARKSIAQRRSENEKSGDKSFRPTQKARDRGKTTDKIRESEKLMNKKPKQADSEKTDVLDDGTELLAPENSIQMTNDSDATDVLSEATEVLVNNATVAPKTDVLPSGLEIIQSIVLIHTNEVING